MRRIRTSIGKNCLKVFTETADENDDFQETQRSVRRVIEAWIPGGVYQSSHYDRMVDRRCTSAADPGERAATLCGTDRVRHTVADPGADATTHGGADCRRPCAAGLGGDCQSHDVHSPGSHWRSTSEQIVDVHTPQVMEEIIGASRG